MADTDAPAPTDSTIATENQHSRSEGEKQPIKPDRISALSKLPGDVKATISKADELLLHLNRMIKSTAGLGAALSTLNYSLYLLAYLHAHSPSRPALIAYISRLVGRTPSKLPIGVLSAQPAISPITPVGALVSDTRTTLRLTGLLPMFVWLKTLLAQRTSTKETGAPGAVDPVIHRVALVQCLAYIAYQLIENVYHLTGKKVIGPHLVASRGGVSKWIAWSCRAWMVGVMSEFVRLWREAKLAKEKGEKLSAKEQQEADRKWWGELQTAIAWMPVAIHYSIEGGIKGMNTGIVGACGLVAGLNNFKNAWAASA